ncbi:MAG: tetratricopeptide repeat protein [Desulfobacula sp.]|nr:tetratricopeptide repeat protein [Desulfobacula sp.]
MTDKSILIVDDNAAGLKLLYDSLASLGYEKIIKADSGDNAWVMLKSNHVDCIICSYEMKEMSGIALLKITRRDDAIFNIPFFLTDDAFTKIKVIKAGQIGVTGLFVIPYNKSGMEAKITMAVNNVKDPVVEKVEIAFAKGMEYIENQKYDQALEVFNSLVEQKENPEYYFNIGYIKTSQEKHSEAIDAFSKATQLDRLFAKAYEEMGRAYKALGDLEKAEEYMQLAAEIYMDTDKIGSAEEILNEILESGSNSLNVFNTLGVLHRKKGDTDVALRQYKKALRVHPDEPYIYYNIGRIYLDMKDATKAKEYFQQALDKDHGFDEAKQVIKAIDLGIV